jgi:hypothetical protein
MPQFKHESLASGYHARRSRKCQSPSDRATIPPFAMVRIIANAGRRHR